MKKTLKQVVTTKQSAKCNGWTFSVAPHTPASGYKALEEFRSANDNDLKTWAYQAAKALCGDGDSDEVKVDKVWLRTWTSGRVAILCQAEDDKGNQVNVRLMRKQQLLPKKETPIGKVPLPGVPFFSPAELVAEQAREVVRDG